MTNPRDAAQPRVEAAKQHERDGRSDLALAQLDLALAADPDHGEALWLRSLYHLDAWRLDLATADLDRLVALAPDFAAAWAVRGDAHTRLMRLDDALADFDESLRLEPDEAGALAGRGMVLRLLDRPDDAIADYSRLLEIDPERTSAYQMRGRAFADADRHDEALADFDRVLQRDPSLIAAYYDRARSWEAKGNAIKAMANYAAAIAASPSARTYNERAKFHYFRKEYAEARADHESALRLTPEDAPTANHLAWILATAPHDEVRDGAKAVELATRACEATEYQEAYCVDTLGTAYAEAGDFESAVRYGEKAVELVDEEARQEYRDRVELYRAGKPFRVD